MRTFNMSDTEDYPGPSRGHPEKQGQHPHGRANEEMVKPTAKPRPENGKKKARRRHAKPRQSGLATLVQAKRGLTRV